MATTNGKTFGLPKRLSSTGQFHRLLRLRLRAGISATFRQGASIRAAELRCHAQPSREDKGSPFAVRRGARPSNLRMKLSPRALVELDLSPARRSLCAIR